MFTGIIQDIGTIESVQIETDQTHMSFHTKLDTSSWNLGDSVAVDGCCLTITSFSGQGFSATLSKETLTLTHLSNAIEGQQVNLEPALKMGDAMGGHIVTGHIDGLAAVKSVTEIGEHREISFEATEGLARYIVSKGSVCINGVSLTVNLVDDLCFTVNLIPHTLSHTNLKSLESGHQVNLETDMLGRYVERMMSFEQRTTQENS
ncbi:MAG: riboflavin synthase [Mariprofundaceae bacterium]